MSAVARLVRDERLRRVGTACAGPALIVASVLFALRWFPFGDALTTQHPDILANWLPHYCFLGTSLADGHVPVWNDLQMAGVPFASDPQSGWLNLPAMALFSTLGCGTALRWFIVLQPLLAGLGLWWFLRREGLHRAAATVGGLSLAMLMATSSLAISLPFAGMLAWTPFVLVGASGFLRGSRWVGRLGWLALAAFAWGQVAVSHMSNGLAMATLITVAYLAARTVGDVRAGTTTGRRGALLVGAFLAFLVAANLAAFVPRLALVPKTSLHGGYAALGGDVAEVVGVSTERLVPGGVWSAWPLAFAGAPGAYAGAVALFAIPAALRARARHLVQAFLGVGIVAWILTLDLLVSAGWFRRLVLALPYGDLYLHNPGRLRNLMALVIPVLGALGVQALLERPPGRRHGVAWIGAGAFLFLLLPLVLGANPLRLALVAAAAVAAVPALIRLASSARAAAVVVVAVLALELLASAVYSQSYAASVSFGLEPNRRNQVPQPLHRPDAPLGAYLTPGPIALAMEGEPGRYLTWDPPAVFEPKAYLYTRGPDTWPALENARGVLFDVPDTQGYSPVQLTRYWSYIRATNGDADIFYNAAFLRSPALSDARLLGARFLVVPTAEEPPIAARPLVSEGRYTLYEIEGWQPLVSVVGDWRVAGDATALREVLAPGFDPGSVAVLREDPGVEPTAAAPGTATVTELSPEHLVVDVEAGGSSIVVVRNVFDPAWTATVDGRSAPVIPTDFFLQGIPVPAGRHEVELIYRDPWIGRGLVASGVVWGALGIIVIALAGRERRSRRRAAAGVAGDAGAAGVVGAADDQPAGAISPAGGTRPRR